MHKLLLTPFGDHIQKHPLFKYIHENDFRSIIKAFPIEMRKLPKKLIKYYKLSAHERKSCFDVCKMGIIPCIELMEDVTLQQIFVVACKYNHMHIIDWIINSCDEIGYQFTQMEMDIACKYGRLNIVKLLDKTRKEGGTINSLVWACKKGHLKVVKWLYQNKYHLYNNDAIRTSCEKKHFKVAKFIHEKFLGKLYTLPKPNSKKTKRKYLMYIGYVHSTNPPTDINLCLGAAKVGDIECLKYAHANGCEWNERVCFIAVDNNKLKCLKYAHKNGCPWNIHDICRRAAFKGYHICLAYAWNNRNVVDSEESELYEEIGWASHMHSYNHGWT